jgi:hypothetical protein
MPVSMHTRLQINSTIVDNETAVALGEVSKEVEVLYAREKKKQRKRERPTRISSQFKPHMVWYH